jgi:NAD(P)-dependent dehydrogenase (short-subunit alcohol dehydrogenase family)
MTNQSEVLSKEQQNRQPGLEETMKVKPEVIRGNYLGSSKLLNKVALITGGDSGIGRSIAVHYAREGADVAIVYLNEHEDAEETKKLVEAKGKSCLLVPGDITDVEFCKHAVEQTIEKYGKLNILVNNAAEQHLQENLEDISYEQLERTFKTNIFSFFTFSQHAVKYFHEGDSIINTASVLAYKSSKVLMDYASTKGAIISFTRGLALNLAPKKIRVNAVAPGPIWTPLIPSTFPPEAIEKFGKATPLGRPGQPSEVGPAYVFLASEDASYITGQVIHPNGGEIVNG